jgi:hypothetical protein
MQESEDNPQSDFSEPPSLPPQNGNGGGEPLPPHISSFSPELMSQLRAAVFNLAPKSISVAFPLPRSPS